MEIYTIEAILLVFLILCHSFSLLFMLTPRDR